LGGLSSEEIARAFLTTEPTIQQRIVRAKRTLAEANVPFELPKGVELAPRLGSVLEVVYLVFNEGYYATAGEDVMRPTLQLEAIRLGALLCELAPSEPEAHGLQALMELTQSRAAARTDAAGDPILLPHQDRTKWDRASIGRGLSSLAKAESLTEVKGPYVLQASIAACHARAAAPGETSWREILALYGELAARHPSPVVELNRAIALAEVEGAAAGLALLDDLASNPALERYHLLPAARADLLERLGKNAEARAEFIRAASLTENARQAARLSARAARLGD
jgi:predicted RNA polymerase sigma factor